MPPTLLKKKTGDFSPIYLQICKVRKVDASSVPAAHGLRYASGPAQSLPCACVHCEAIIAQTYGFFHILHSAQSSHPFLTHRAQCLLCPAQRDLFSIRASVLHLLHCYALGTAHSFASRAGAGLFSHPARAHDLSSGMCTRTTSS